MTPASDATTPRVALGFLPRPTPLDALAVAATSHAKALARAALRRTDAELAALRGVAGASVLVLLGPAEQLPWCDGAIYLGRDPAAPSLLLPTTLTPTLPLPLVERAIGRHVDAARVAAPIAVIHDGSLSLLSVSAARPVSRRLLEAWCEALP